MQETWVWSLVQEDPACLGATKPLWYNYLVQKPQLLSPCATTTEAGVSWSLCSATRKAWAPQLETSPRSNEDPAQPKRKKEKEQPLRTWTSRWSSVSWRHTGEGKEIRSITCSDTSSVTSSKLFLTSLNLSLLICKMELLALGLPSCHEPSRISSTSPAW